MSLLSPTDQHYSAGLQANSSRGNAGNIARDEQNLHASLENLSSVVIAFSGGVDSALLAYAALQVLGADRVLAVTAVSDSLAQGELEHCSSTAKNWGLPWASVSTEEFTNPDYIANQSDRCFWCKDALMTALAPLAAERDAQILLGVNLDDLG
ncbi:MAG: hypothetical protein WD029_08485, partial [Microthrixaceae bacterium]